MFVQIEDNYLKMNRGDTYQFPLVINEGTKLCFKQYQLRQFDKIYIGIMEPNQSFENALIRKVLTITSPCNEYGHPIVTLEPKDTEYVLTGKYFIEIKLVQKDMGKDIVTTILPMREFFINGTNKEVINNTYNINKGLIVKDKNAEWEQLENAPTPPEPVIQEYEWISI